MQAKYKRMLKSMRDQVTRDVAASVVEPWFLYILQCCDGTYYTGITKDLGRRLRMHESGRASRYTRTRRPVQLRYQERCSGRAQALIRECRVKAFSRRQKQQLILGQIPD